MLVDEDFIVQIKSRNKTFIGFHITDLQLREGSDNTLLNLYVCEPVIQLSIHLIYWMSKGKPEVNSTLCSNNTFYERRVPVSNMCQCLTPRS